MKQKFQGWSSVASRLQQEAERQKDLAVKKGENHTHLNEGQRASLRVVASRIEQNGLVIADEVGMGKTRIAVEVARAVTESGGRVAILVPPGLGYQWQAELRDGELKDVPPVLRSMWAFLGAWSDEEPKNHQPWFDKNVVIVSHGITNWRIGQSTTQSWRWALVPELYARWRKLSGERLPRGYRGNEQLKDPWVDNAAESICQAVPKEPKHPVRKLLNKILSEIRWPQPLAPAEYSKDASLRLWLERSVGIGLGVFDLVIIDEAHKSRGSESGLSRLVKHVIVSADTTRRLALTATPVELDVSQWENTLGRIGLRPSVLQEVKEASERYADAVKRLRQTWRSSREAPDNYKDAAKNFEETLSPYILRRDKREDPHVQLFCEYTKLPFHEYRRESEITVDTGGLSPGWKKAICAAESLSVVTRQSNEPVAKRLRLTLGNGHGITALLDQINRDKEDRKQEEEDEKDRENGPHDDEVDTLDSKREQRGKWWQDAIVRAFDNGDTSLFDHPAIQKAVEAIEHQTNKGEKVLVFGRFTRPMRAMVGLINARAMLKCVQNGKPWPQTKVRGDRDGDFEHSDWPAVLAARRQLNSPASLDTIDESLRKAYDRQEHSRETFRRNLISQIEKGFDHGSESETRIKAIFDAFKRSVDRATQGEGISLALVSRAIMDLLGAERSDPSASDCANAFREIILAASDKDDAERDDELEDEEAGELWETIEPRLKDEYNRPQGGFARLMFGGTSQASRRMIQLAFNRPNSFPRVLVAQSLVGREGLNLHKSCRIVVLLHPEWNPGVVEQQIGRVDRVDSHWCNALNRSIEANDPVDKIPRIEVHPVMFQGTYDELNWKVLQTRWDDLRAQLHGIVIPPSIAGEDLKEQRLLNEIADSAPNFSPLRHMTSPEDSPARRFTLTPPYKSHE